MVERKGDTEEVKGNRKDRVKGRDRGPEKKVKQRGREAESQKSETR